MAEFLGSRKVTAESLIRYYNDVYPNTSRKEDKADSPVSSYDQPGAQYAEGSWWQALNSVTYITDHVQGRNAENRLHSQWFGGNQVRKVKAAERAVELANAV